MEASKLNVNIKPEFLPFLEAQNYKYSIDEKVNLSLAIFFFTERAVTLARAAELSGKSLAEFVEILTSHNIAWNEFTDDHLRQDENALQYILGEEKHG